MMSLNTYADVQAAKALIQDFDGRMYIERDSFFDNNFDVVANENELEQLRSAVQETETVSKFIEHFGLSTVSELLEEADSLSTYFVWHRETEINGVTFRKGRNVCLRELKRQIKDLEQALKGNTHE